MQDDQLKNQIVQVLVLKVYEQLLSAPSSQTGLTEDESFSLFVIVVVVVGSDCGILHACIASCELAC